MSGGAAQASLELTHSLQQIRGPVDHTLEAGWLRSFVCHKYVTRSERILPGDGLRCLRIGPEILRPILLFRLNSLIAAEILLLPAATDGSMAYLRASPECRQRLMWL